MNLHFSGPGLPPACFRTQTLAFLLLAGFLALGIAGGVALGAEDPGAVRLRAFLHRVTTMTADFRQEVVDASGVVVEESSGSVSMQRPGRFRWDYREPFERLIVADGERLWLYEADLEQVTIRRLDDGIGDTPAALVTGRTEVLERFRVERSWQTEGLLWVSLVPRAAEADFSAVRLAFAGDELRRLELDDRMGQQTRVTLSGVRVNTALPAETFRFDAPPGADVIDESAL